MNPSPPPPRRRDLSGIPTADLERISAKLGEAIATLDSTGYCDTAPLKSGLADVEAELISRTIAEQRPAAYVSHNGHRLMGSGF